MGDGTNGAAWFPSDQCALPARLLLAASLALIGGCTGEPAYAPGTYASLVRRATLAKVDASGATIAVDLFEASSFRVEVRAETAPGEVEPWLEHGGSGSVDLHHEVDLSPLTPRTTYEYRVYIDDWPPIEEDADGTPLSFRTPALMDAGDFVAACALVIADPQNGAFDEALPGLGGLRPEVDFVLSLGDQVTVAEAPTPSATESLYLDYLLGPLSQLTAHVPLMSVVGNHDMGDSYDTLIRADALDLYARHMVHFENGPPDAPPETVYSFDWEALHIAVLDSTGPLAMRERGALDERQLTWLAEDMAAVPATQWRIVALHHMVHGWQTPDTPAPAEWFHVENFEEAHRTFVAAGVDLVLNGHRHAYNVFVLDGVRYVTFPTVSRDMVLFDRFGAANWRNLGGEEGTLDRAVGDVFGYATLCGDGTALTLDTVLYDGVRPGLVPVPVAPAVFVR